MSEPLNCPVCNVAPTVRVTASLHFVGCKNVHCDEGPFTVTNSRQTALDTWNLIAGKKE